VKVQFSADTFVVKIATFAKPENVMGKAKTKLAYCQKDRTDNGIKFGV
jgi:hypothetical protein